MRRLALLAVLVLAGCGYGPLTTTETKTETKTVEVEVEVPVPFTPKECRTVIRLLKESVAYTADAGVASLNFDDFAFLTAIRNAKRSLREAQSLEGRCLG